MRRLTAVALASILMASVPWATAQDKGETPTYLLLATKRTGTMQKEIDEAADQGYRILTGSPTSGDEMALFLQKTALPSAPYKYRLLATTRTGTMERELNEAAEGGFRLITSTMIAKKQIIGGVEIVALLERPPKVEKTYQYKLLATSRTSTLQKEVSEAQAAGYVIVGMVSRGEHMVVVERESPAE
jgi:hypothetical protein